MGSHFDRKIVIFLILATIVFGAYGTAVFNHNFANESKLNSNGTGAMPDNYLSPVPLSSVQTGPMNAFPGQLINESYYLGSTVPSVSYYMVTVTLNGSSYETLDAFPAYTGNLNPSGYYLFFSFEMPNDQPGMWWNVGYQIIPVTVSTGQEIGQVNLIAQGSQIWMQYQSESMAGNYMVKGSANFTSSSNVSQILLYPFNPQGTVIVSSQVNSWTFSSGILEVNFSLYEYLDTSNGKTTPPVLVATAYYTYSSSFTVLGSPISISGYSIKLIQGDGAYLYGITSNQLAEITNSINQSLSIPISQLNAAVVSINGDVAELQTSFGTMTTNLNSIDATVVGISSGISYLNTTLGMVKTSLSSINATIISVKGNTINLETSVGNVSTNLNAIGATIKNINNGQATILTDVGSLQVPLGSINASVQSISKGEATLITDVGIVQTSLSSLSTTVTSVTSGEAQIETSIGDVTTSIESLNASFKGMDGDYAILQTDVGSIKTSLNSINATIYAIHQGMIQMNTSIGNIQIPLKSLNSTIVKISGDTADLMTTDGNIEASLDDINTSIFDTNIDTPWLNNSYAYIETCLGNLTGTITDVSNNTATIETNLGVVTTSLNSIKSASTQATMEDPPSLFDIVIIAFLVAVTGIATLAMLSARSTLKIMGDKVK
ncbi:MAG: PKD protein [Thermoplasmatales archaeon I-plasma]|jgi:hypothetical protein|nr:MAG: PKD protein [Thermoplasmatales archaeon I-plasma]